MAVGDLSIVLQLVAEHLLAGVEVGGVEESGEVMTHGKVDVAKHLAICR